MDTPPSSTTSNAPLSHIMTHVSSIALQIKPIFEIHCSRPQLLDLHLDHHMSLIGVDKIEFGLDKTAVDKTGLEGLGIDPTFYN